MSPADRGIPGIDSMKPEKNATENSGKSVPAHVYSAAMPIEDQPDLPAVAHDWLMEEPLRPGDLAVYLWNRRRRKNARPWRHPRGRW